jgi:hypothetical protein
LNNNISSALAIYNNNNNNNNNSYQRRQYSTTSGGIDYEPVILVRSRSNSIFSNSSNDDECDYDVMSLAATNSHYTQYDDWTQYGILPNPEELNELRETCCSLCGKDEQNALHYKYFSGCTPESEQLGYNICFFCKFKFELVIKKRAELIWDLLDNKSVTYFWAPRTRRDPLTNQRIYSGPFTYEKWRPVSNYVSYMTDSTKGYPGLENTPFIFCSLENLYEPNVSKLIPIVDILKSNYNACKTGLYDTSYDPNIDDPINTLELPPDAKINLRY